MSEAESAGRQKVLKCYHCGNQTLMNLVGEHEERWDEGYAYEGLEKYEMYVCPICRAVTLICDVWQESQQHQIDGSCKEEYLYPLHIIRDDYLPTQVRTAFEAAIKTKEIDSAVCLIALRRTLEIVCREKNATGRDLWHKIEDLSNKGILPEQLKNASIITKTYGNMGAHEENISISKIELLKIIDLVQYILDYLYIVPGKIAEAQEKMKEQSPSNDSENI